jgi:hypothetical protein
LESISLTVDWAKGHRDIDGGFGVVDRFEKREADEVVPVGVGKKQGIVVAPFPEQGVSQTPDARSRVDDDDFIVLGPHLDAGRVSPVFEVLCTGYRYGPPCAPATDDHRRSSIQDVLPFMLLNYCESASLSSD